MDIKSLLTHYLPEIPFLTTEEVPEAPEAPSSHFFPQGISIPELSTEMKVVATVATAVALATIACLYRSQHPSPKLHDTFPVFRGQPYPKGIFEVLPNGTLKFADTKGASTDQGMTIDSQTTHLKIVINGSPGGPAINTAERVIEAWKAPHQRNLQNPGSKETFSITGEGEDPYTFRIEVNELDTPLTRDEQNQEKRKLDALSLYKTEEPMPEKSIGKHEASPAPIGTFVIHSNVESPVASPSGTFVADPANVADEGPQIADACALAAGAQIAEASAAGKVEIDSQIAYLQIIITGQPKLDKALRTIRGWKHPFRRELDVDECFKTFAISGQTNDDGKYVFRIEMTQQDTPLSKDQKIEEKRKLDDVSLYKTDGPGPAAQQGLIIQSYEEGIIGIRTLRARLGRLNQ